jgi:phenylalanyl-tRNA synthetase alpha chain
MENLEELKSQILQNISSATDLKALDDIRVSVLGKKGSITEKMKNLGALPLEEKIATGKALNVLKSAIEAAIHDKKQELETVELNQKLAN